MDPQTRRAITIELAAGRFADAKAMIDVHLAAHPDDLVAQVYRGTMRLELGETEAARDELARTGERAEAAGDAEAAAFAQLWLGYLHNRREERERAVEHFERSAALAPPSTDLCAALCQTYARLGRDGPARDWGAKSLALRAAEGDCAPSERVARARPRAFDPTARRRNVLAFSLFGADPYYRECAVTIARSARGIFPEFTCRFYCAPEIPDPVRGAIAAAGAQVMVVTARDPGPQHPFAGLMWRFLAFDDPQADLVLVRDVDSPFTLRERAAIDLWLSGEAPFVTIRDHVNHTEPLMAGMWGGFTGLLPPLGPGAARFLPPDRSRYVDQQFLRRFVWPRIRDATLAVDSVYALGESVDFPPGCPAAGSIRAGSGWSRKQILGAG
jgi:hypothetical protein